MTFLNPKELMMLMLNPNLNDADPTGPSMLQLAELFLLCRVS